MTTEKRLGDALGYLREAEGDNPLVFDGVFPYGQVSSKAVREYGKPEAFAPGAFKGDAEKWMARADGGRLPFKDKHSGTDIGSVTMLRDESDGLHFRVELDDDPAGQAYARKARAGRNAISPEFDPDEQKSSTRGAVVIHRDARLYSIAGSVTPAYDGARLSLRDMEDTVAEQEPTKQDVAEPAPVRTAEAVAQERDQISAITRGVSPATIAVTRPEAQYGRDATDERGEWRSFLRDFYLAHNGDSGAMERQERHNRHLADISGAMARAGDVLSSEIPGAYPNLYLPGLFTPRILKSRPMANFIGSYAIDNALPRIFAKVTTSTSATVQAAQTTNPAASDFATTAVTATPLLYGASSLVARQVVDGASPAAETMLLQDMYEAYGQVTEAAAVTAVEAGASASGTAITAATPYAGVLGNVIKYQATRFNPADGQFVPSALYSVLLAQGDTTGRPFLPMIGLMNSDGSVASGAVSGGVLGAQTILSWGSTVNVVVTLRRTDYVCFESPTLSFRYEQATGPAGFNIGVWGYFVVAARLGGLSVTAA
jgi:phage head maturation protease